MAGGTNRYSSSQAQTLPGLTPREPPAHSLWQNLLTPGLLRFPARVPQKAHELTALQTCCQAFGLMTLSTRQKHRPSATLVWNQRVRPSTSPTTTSPLPL